MSYKYCTPEYIARAENPFHIISKNNSIFSGYGLWIDLEKGGDDPLNPLTPCIKFSILDYMTNKRKEVFTYKMTNISEVRLLIKMLQKYYDLWDKDDKK